MTQPDDDPDWNLLPDDPAGFFGLADGFDQRELKRRYNALIRRFKPEKSPAEFQRIRAAFESLDRYFSGRDFRGSLPPTVIFAAQQPSWDEFDESAKVPEHISPRSKPRITLLERVRRDSPAALLDELRNKPHHNREERILLAFLKDAGSAENSSDFLDALLVAVRTGCDEESTELLRQYLRSDEAAARCSEILEQIFFVLATDDVYPLTQPLWDELQSRVPFQDFETILANCMRHVKDHREAGRLMFELRLLKRTLFYADPAWTAARMAWMTRGDAGWPDWLDREIWSIERLVEYTKVRRRLLNGNPVRSQLDQIFQAYCLDAPEFDQLFLNFQAQIRSDFDTVCAAFPVHNDHLNRTVWNAWQFLSEQVAYRFETDETYSIQDSLEGLQSLPARLRSVSRPLIGPPRYWNGIGWTIIGLLYGGPPLLFFLLALATQQRLQSLGVPLLVSAAGLIVGIAGHLMLGSTDVLVNCRLGWPLYAMRMRQELSAFMRRHPLPPALLFGRLRQLGLGNVLAEKLLSQSERDFALRFYAAAAWNLR